MADSSFRYADRTVLVVLANGIKAFADVLTGIVLARLLSQNDFGSYRQLLLLFVTLAGLTGMGLPQALLFFVPRRRDRNAPAFVARTSRTTASISSERDTYCSLRSTRGMGSRTGILLGSVAHPPRSVGGYRPVLYDSPAGKGTPELPRRPEAP